MFEWPAVKEDDDGIRPAGKPDECFYCKSKVGELHGPDCVTVTRPAKLKAIIEFETDEPASWTVEDIEFRYNEGTWCASNLLNILNKMNAEHGCMCACTTIKVVSWEGGKKNA